ncbi:hypothetical protein Bache_2722 [Bacteroides helcogenes P 36-108]|uniref:Uncharacterized protein n=1 Tax=Bacteroides helcogenes (strain ATCC 35417 / DSM 20613 / JCM 6297 / CCUG 15421 / P 36-108) TaxID=693979 RepID=E6SWX9_BACT6|nr:hypothetical protein Bache_2722 [Bacteroides helcogenes P 36-108]
MQFRHFLIRMYQERKTYRISSSYKGKTFIKRSFNGRGKGKYFLPFICTVSSLFFYQLIIFLSTHKASVISKIMKRR